MEFSADKNLWNRVRQDDSTAFSTLFDQYWEAMFSMAWRRIGDEEAAKDLVQNIFIRCWEHRQAIEITESLGPYLMTALKYSVIRHIYQAARKGYTHLPLSVYDIPEEEKPFLSDWEDYQQIQQAINTEVIDMPRRMQQIFRLHQEQQLSVKAIALQLSLSEQTVKNTLHIAMNRLRSRLKGYDTLLLFFL